MMQIMRQICGGVLLFGVTIVCFTGQALAGNGWYMGADLGANLAQRLDVSGTDNDYSTKCDAFLNPDGYDLDVGACDMPPPPASLFNEFDGGGGILTGLAVGYRWRGFRLEGEYFYRGATYDDTDEVLVRGQDEVSARKIREELNAIEGAVDDVLSHNFFANLYYDFRTKSRWTPYVGIGVGAARVSLDYFTRWQRSSNPADIDTFNGPNPVTNRNLDQNLAGTTTIGRTTFTDTLFGYQAIAGMDYRVSEPVTIGLKFRWANFSEFKDDDEYRALRSHDSTNSPDPTDPRSARVRYGISTEDLSFWGVSLNMKYHFDPGAPATFISGEEMTDRRWYVGMDVGVAVSPDLDTHSRDNDLPSTCDQFITDEAYSTRLENSCPSGLDQWTTQFDGGAGVLAGLQVGYRVKDFRIEGEYFYRDAGYDQATAPLFDGMDIKTLEEIAESEEAIDDVLSHNFFANLYYDVPSTSRWMPYFGVGVGVARVTLDEFSRYRRSSDPDDITTFGAPTAENLERRQRLAGTTTIGRDKFSDTLFGWQVLAGLDYRISRPFSIGFKFRYADFTQFEDDAEWRQLRSHDSTNADDPDDPRSFRVRYRVNTDDITFWGVSLNLKYHF